MRTALPVGLATMEKQFDGDVTGRSATLFTAAYELLVIVPGSGTEALSGITGHGSLDGETHQITFEYEISAAPPADGAAGPRPAAG